jgi:hypothetical protein
MLATCGGDAPVADHDMCASMLRYLVDISSTLVAFVEAYPDAAYTAMPAGVCCRRCRAARVVAVQRPLVCVDLTGDRCRQRMWLGAAEFIVVCWRHRRRVRGTVARNAACRWPSSLRVCYTINVASRGSCRKWSRS